MIIVRYRVERHAPPHQDWHLSAVTLDNWILDRLFLPESVRDDLYELEEYRQGRGGMRPTVERHDPHVDLLVVHENVIKHVQIEATDNMDVLLAFMASEYGCAEEDVLLMKNKPGSLCAFCLCSRNPGDETEDPLLGRSGGMAENDEVWVYAETLSS